jgi:hypothetical protein
MNRRKVDMSDFKAVNVGTPIEFKPAQSRDEECNSKRECVIKSEQLSLDKMAMLFLNGSLLVVVWYIFHFFFSLENINSTMTALAVTLIFASAFYLNSVFNYLVMRPRRLV